MNKSKPVVKKVVVKPKIVKEPVVEEVILTESESSNKIEGLGDVIAVITKAVGIQPCEECEQRRRRLNKFYPFTKNAKRDLTDEEIVYIQELKEANRIPSISKFLEIFNGVYGANQKGCNCPALMKDLLDKLVVQIEYQKD